MTEATNPPESLLALPVATAARRVAMDHLDAARAAARRLEAGDDAEALHDVRVAIRRLRSWVRALPEVLDPAIARKHRKALRMIMRGTSEARDAEVHLAWLAEADKSLGKLHRVGTAWLAERLRPRTLDADPGRRARLAADVIAIDAELAPRLLPPPDEPTDSAAAAAPFALHLATLLRELDANLAEALAAIRSVDDQDQAHAARIAGKRLRYVVEPLAPELPLAAELVKDLKRLQDVLGDMHDAHVFGEWLVDQLGVAAADHARLTADAVLAHGFGSPEARRIHRRDPRWGLLALIARLRAERNAKYQEPLESSVHGKVARLTGWLEGGVEVGNGKGETGNVTN